MRVCIARLRADRWFRAGREGSLWLLPPAAGTGENSGENSLWVFDYEVQRRRRTTMWKWPFFSAINHTFFWRTARPSTGHFLHHLQGRIRGTSVPIYLIRLP